MRVGWSPHPPLRGTLSRRERDLAKTVLQRRRDRSKCRMQSRWFIGVAALAAAAFPILQGQVRNPQRNPAADWPMYNRDLSGTRFSPLNQITARNVARLTPVWTYKVGKVKAEGITGGTE